MSQIILDSNSIRDQYGFTIADNVVLMSTKLPNQSKLLYFHLKNFYYKVSQAYDLGYDKEFYISREELARLMQLSPTSVDTYMKPLKDIGLVQVKSQGVGKPNVYVLPEITEEIVDLLEPDIRKFKLKKYGSQNTVNVADSIRLTETGLPNTVNVDDSIRLTTPQNTVNHPAEYCQQINNINKNNINKNNINKNNNIINAKPSNIAKQKSLFSIPSDKDNTTKRLEELIMSKRKGAPRSLAKMELYNQGLLNASAIEVEDLCHYYCKLHQEIVGTIVKVQNGGKSFQDMQIFLDNYGLSIEEAITLFPKLLAKFKEIDEVKPKKERQHKLHIGNLPHRWAMDELMDKVLPKVNKKYLQEEPEKTPSDSLFKQVDEVF